MGRRVQAKLCSILLGLGQPTSNMWITYIPTNFWNLVDEGEEESEEEEEEYDDVEEVQNIQDDFEPEVDTRGDSRSKSSKFSPIVQILSNFFYLLEFYFQCWNCFKSELFLSLCSLTIKIDFKNYFTPKKILLKLSLLY